MLAEDIPNCDIFFSQIWLHSFVNDFDRHTGRAYKKVLSTYEGYHLWFYFGERDSREVEEHIVDRIIADPRYGVEINTGILQAGDQLRNEIATFPVEKIRDASLPDLWEMYRRHYEVHQECYAWYWIGNATDMFHATFTNRLKIYLESVGVSEDEMGQTLATLTTPTKRTPIFVEQQELLTIAKKIENDPELFRRLLAPDSGTVWGECPEWLQKEIQIHWQKYHYTKFIFVSGEYTVVDYVAQLQEIFRSGKHASQILVEQMQSLGQAEMKKQELMQGLAITSNWQQIFGVFGDFMVSKIYRRYAQLYALHRMDVVIKEIARRMYLTPMQVRFMMKDEVEAMLLRGEYDEHTFQERTQFCVYYAERGYEEIIIGDEARRLAAEAHRVVDQNITEFLGQTGCPGYAKGKVKIVIRAEEMGKMNDGDILVSIATDPDIVSAMKRAGAIVTEQGGVTSHAAIVSREIGIPCVIGTKIATRVLKDGDVVEVNANTGLVKIIERV